MLDVPALLLTTLKELTEEQLKTFQSRLTSGWMLGFPLIPESQLENSDRQETVDQMVKGYGPERAVRNTLRILMWMKLGDLAEQLQRDYIGVLLLTSLEELTEEQLKTFQSKLNVGRMLGSPPIPEKQLENTSRQETVDQMVKRYCPEGAMRITLWILREMNLDDLAEKLERDYTRGNNNNSHLNGGRMLGFPPIPESQLENSDRQDTVDQMVKSYGPERAVKNTLRILMCMDLDDLAEQLERDYSRGIPTAPYQSFFQPRPFYGAIHPLPSSSPSFLLSLTSAGTSGHLSSQEVAASGKERKPAGEESEEPSSELPSPSSGMLTLSGEKCRSLETVISSLKGNLEVLNVGKRPSMLDVPALLLTSLEELTEEQLKTFQSHLTRGQLFGFPLIPERQLENTSRQETVDQMVKSYGPERAVEITLWILREMNLDDLAETLQRDYTRVLLLTSLEELTEEQLKTFQSKLNVGRMLGSPPIPEKQLENTSRQETVDQMVKRFCPEGAMRITLWILREMNLDDLAEKLERDYTRVVPHQTLDQVKGEKNEFYQLKE
ncbi:uncharacterized protein [Salvelinus alpinus]|uniref:uncharacterized protein n=1 Tax=Salvelinus alpinus TaxID=8036 RepID=UPI0039FD1871